MSNATLAAVSDSHVPLTTAQCMEQVARDFHAWFTEQPRNLEGLHMEPFRIARHFGSGEDLVDAAERIGGEWEVDRDGAFFALRQKMPGGLIHLQTKHSEMVEHVPVTARYRPVLAGRIAKLIGGEQ